MSRLFSIVLTLFLAGFAAAGPKSDSGPSRIEGRLKAGDAPDPVTKNPRQVHAVTLRGDRSYSITLRSYDKGLDPFLRLEDAAGKELARDDDGGGGLDAWI